MRNENEAMEFQCPRSILEIGQELSPIAELKCHKNTDHRLPAAEVCIPFEENLAICTQTRWGNVPRRLSNISRIAEQNIVLKNRDTGEFVTLQQGQGQKYTSFQEVIDTVRASEDALQEFADQELQEEHLLPFLLKMKEVAPEIARRRFASLINDSVPDLDAIPWKSFARGNRGMFDQNVCQIARTMVTLDASDELPPTYLGECIPHFTFEESRAYLQNILEKRYSDDREVRQRAYTQLNQFIYFNSHDTLLVDLWEAIPKTDERTKTQILFQINRSLLPFIEADYEGQQHIIDWRLNEEEAFLSRPEETVEFRIAKHFFRKYFQNGGDPVSYDNAYSIIAHTMGQRFIDTEPERVYADYRWLSQLLSGEASKEEIEELIFLRYPDLIAQYSTNGESLARVGRYFLSSQRFQNRRGLTEEEAYTIRDLLENEHTPLEIKRDLLNDPLFGRNVPPHRVYADPDLLAYLSEHPLDRPLRDREQQYIGRYTTDPFDQLRLATAEDPDFRTGVALRTMNPEILQILIEDDDPRVQQIAQTRMDEVDLSELEAED